MTVYSVDLRKRVVSAYKVGNTSIRKLAEQFQVTKRTVHRWIKQHRETGDLTPLKAGTKRTSCLESQKQHILQMVAENPDCTLREYCEELGEKTGVYVSQATMCLFLKREQQTLKKTFRSEKVASSEGQQQRLNYWNQIREIDPNNLIFIDETGIWEDMERQKARSPKGRKAFSQRGCYKSQKYTIIGAISVNGMVCLRIIKNSMKGADFLEFVKKDLCPKLDSSKIVIMDNLRAHKMDEVESAIRATGAKIIYLSSYSPDFNPIEMLWSVLKAFVRKFSPKTLKGIQWVLEIFVLILDKSFFRNWFAKCCYCIP